MMYCIFYAFRIVNKYTYIHTFIGSPHYRIFGTIHIFFVDGLNDPWNTFITKLICLILYYFIIFLKFFPIMSSKIQ